VPRIAFGGYGPNAERLIKAKQSYDPDNVFRSAVPLPVAGAMAGAPLRTNSIAIMSLSAQAKGSCQ
jgi:hypothetical protein